MFELDTDKSTHKELPFHPIHHSSSLFTIHGTFSLFGRVGVGSQFLRELFLLVDNRSESHRGAWDYWSCLALSSQKSQQFGYWSGNSEAIIQNMAVQWCTPCICWWSLISDLWLAKLVAMRICDAIGYRCTLKWWTNGSAFARQSSNRYAAGVFRSVYRCYYSCAAGCLEVQDVP